MPKSPRYAIRLTFAFVSRFKLILLLGVGIGLISFIAIGVLMPSLSKKRQTIGVIGRYTVENLPSKLSKMVSIGLTQIDPSGQATPGIAESWEASDDGKTWTFHLYKNLTFQDGSGVTSSNINYNFADASITRPDKYTIVYKLKTPLAPFPVALGKPIFKQGFLGLGQWRVSGLTLAGNYIETLTLDDKNNHEDVFKFYPTEDAAKLAYQLGEINILPDLIDPKPFDSWGNIVSVTKDVNKQRYVAVFFNTSGEVVGDKDIRQALTYAIDKAQFGQERALGPISPNSWSFNPGVKPYDFNIDRAKELIKYSKIPDDAKKNLKIKLTVIPDLLNVADEISKNWKQIGIDTTLQVTSFVPDQYQAFLAIYDIPTDPDQYSTWHGTQAQSNISRYQNTRVSKLLEDGRIETNQDKRKQIYFDFQRFLVEDSPAAFLYYPVYYTVNRK